MVDLGLVRLEPWLLLGDDERMTVGRRLGRTHPDMRLLPFAVRRGDDLVACWQHAPEFRAVVVFHPSAADGWESRVEFPHFHAWLREAVEDFILDFW